MSSAEDAGMRGRPVVLVVDDEPAGRYLLSTVLGARGYTVLEAADGAEALAVARRSPVDVVVTDILMPEMDGYGLARAWRADAVLSEVPLLFYTATYTEPADEHFALSLGADAFLRKPMDPDAIVREIERARASHTPRDAGDESPHEVAILREYNERLISKLEHKLDELRAANVQLVRERDFSNRVIETTELLIVAVDTEGRLTMFSHGAEQVTGLRAPDVIGKPFLSVLAPPDEEVRHEDVMARMMTMSGGTRWTARIRTSGGEVRWVDWSGSQVLGVDGLVEGFLAFGLDVTERRRLELARSGFVAAVSHELRTPLTSIIGYADLLASMGDAAGPDARARMVRQVQENAERMRALVEDLLEVAHMQTEGLRVVRRPVAVDVVLRTLESAPVPPSHRLSVTAEPDVPELLCDPERLSEALMRLVENAVKYSPEGGLVDVRARCRGDVVAISVTDEGVGISADDMPHIFDRFTQGDMSSTRPFGGVGLGLYTAREIVQAHGGRILVRSVPGQGSTFTVELPSRDEA